MATGRRNMVVLQTIDVDLTGWLTFLALVLGPGLVAALLWSPFLLSSRLRRLFRRLPPTGSVVASYVPVAVGASLPYVIGAGWAIVASADGSGAAMANALLDVVVPLSVGYVAGVPAVAAAALPRLGVDWDPAGYGASTWLLLAAGGAWYALVLGGPLFVIALILAFPG